MNRKYRRITLASSDDADFRAFVEREQCPSCAEDIYVLDVIEGAEGEAQYLTNRGIQHLPYRLWECSSCGCQFREVLSTVAVDMVRESDIDLE